MNLFFTRRIATAGIGAAAAAAAVAIARSGPGGDKPWTPSLRLAAAAGWSTRNNRSIGSGYLGNDWKRRIESRGRGRVVGRGIPELSGEPMLVLSFKTQDALAAVREGGHGTVFPGGDRSTIWNFAGSHGAARTRNGGVRRTGFAGDARWEFLFNTQSGCCWNKDKEAEFHAGECRGVGYEVWTLEGKKGASMDGGQAQKKK